MKSLAKAAWGVLLLIITGLFTAAVEKKASATNLSSSLTPAIQILDLYFPLPADKLWVVNTYPNHHWGAQNGEWEYAADFYYADDQNNPNSCSFVKGGGVDTPVYAAYSGTLWVQVRDARIDVKNFTATYPYYFLIKIVNKIGTEELEIRYIHLDIEQDGKGYVRSDGEKALLSKIAKRIGKKPEELATNVEYDLGWVNQGEVIGYLDQLGQAALPHLHFEVKLGGKFVRLDEKGPIRLNGEIILDSTYECKNVRMRYLPMPRKKFSLGSATILVIDVSGSMASQWHGGIKIESAKKAALQYIEQVANEPRPVGVTHYIGVVTFSDSASVVCPLTTSYDAAKKTVISLGTIAWTNLGAGLDTALQELSKLPAGAKKFIILLSDGMTNRGKSREAILQTSVAEARRQGICIHTVGFGDPGDIDEDFLKKIATQSGCGSYNYASSGFELFTTYVKVRHATLGSNRFVEYKTTTPAYFFPGESITLGAFQLTAPAQELHYTVAWSGPVVLQAKLVDPQGRVVDNRYPNSVIYSGSGFSHVTVFSPIPGIWRAAATVKSAAMQPAEYYGVASARTGGYVIPYIPPPCLVKADNTCVIPMPDLPTAVVVAIGVAVWIWWFYNQIFK